MSSQRCCSGQTARFLCLGGHGILCTAVAGHGKSGEGDFCNDAGGTPEGILPTICWESSCAARKLEKHLGKSPDALVDIIFQYAFACCVVCFFVQTLDIMNFHVAFHKSQF